jgi:hypothetical protein|tara:strand:+ start:327 stop:521 length:195 start_codon:yes stop_codon:yes gene_type:complete
MNKFIEVINDMVEVITGERPKEPKPKRARTKGRYKADDKSTKEINEAWVGGKAPKKRRKKNAKK